MRKLLAFLKRQTVEATPKIVSQVVVSVAATVCVALITNAYLGITSPASAPPQPGGVSVVPKAAPGSARAEPVRDGPAIHSPQVTTPEKVLRDRAEESSMVLVPVEWLAPHVTAMAEPERAPAQPKKQRKPASSDRTPSPVRPAPEAVTVAAARPEAGASPAAEAEDRIRLLGIPLPGLAPMGKAIVETVESWGGSVLKLAAGI